jgi:hypothetical protein
MDDVKKSHSEDNHNLLIRLDERMINLDKNVTEINNTIRDRLQMREEASRNSATTENTFKNHESRIEIVESKVQEALIEARTKATQLKNYGIIIGIALGLINIIQFILTFNK